MKLQALVLTAYYFGGTDALPQEYKGTERHRVASGGTVVFLKDRVVFLQRCT